MFHSVVCDMTGFHITFDWFLSQINKFLQNCTTSEVMYQDSTYRRPIQVLDSNLAGAAWKRSLETLVERATIFLIIRGSQQNEGSRSVRGPLLCDYATTHGRARPILCFNEDDGVDDDCLQKQEETCHYPCFISSLLEVK